MQWFAGMWPFVVLGVVVTVSAVTDVRSGRVPNYVTYTGIAVGLIAHTLLGGLRGAEAGMGLYGSLAGFAAGFLPMLAVWLAGGIGGGDAKLMGAVGALTGWRFALSALFYGLLVALLLAAIVMLRKRIVRRTLRRLFRFLVLMMTPSRPADPAAGQSEKVPFALALCIGSAAALVEALLRGPSAVKLLGF
ncbi:MAG: A24 family peptidase [Phycisphaerae bacterium]